MADSIADCAAAEPLVASSGAAEPVLDLTCHPTICPGLYKPRRVRVFILGWNGMHQLSRKGWERFLRDQEAMRVQNDDGGQVSQAKNPRRGAI